MPTIALPARYKSPYGTRSVLTPPDSAPPGFREDDPDDGMDGSNVDYAGSAMPGPAAIPQSARNGAAPGTSNTVSLEGVNGKPEGLRKFRLPSAKPSMPPPEVEAPPQSAGTSTPTPSPAATATTPTSAGPAPETAFIGQMDRTPAGIVPPPSGGVVAPTAPTTAEERRAAIEAERPEAPHDNWAQRFGRAILSLTKFAPAANMLMHPKWSEQEATYQRDLANETQREQLEQTQAGTEALSAQREASAAQKEALGESYKLNADTRRFQAEEKTRDTLIKSGAVLLNPNEDVPQGFAQLHNPANPSEIWVRRSGIIPLPNDPQWLKKFPSLKPGDPITLPEFDSTLKAFAAEQLHEKEAAAKPEPAAAAKQAFQQTLSKLSAAEGLPPDAGTSVASLGASIRNSKALTPEEKNSALAYLTANPTPAATAGNMIIRMVGMQQSREYPIINRDTGQLEMRSAAEINASPGTFAPAGAGAAAMSKNAIFQDLHYNIDTARKAVNALEDMDTGTRAALSYALRHTDPRSSVQTFLTGEVGTHLNPQQQEAVQSLALLAENAMSLRSVAGMGQGSDELRAAILATLPSGKSPSKGYALNQLNKFEQVVGRLEKGVPGMGAAGGGSRTTEAPPMPATLSAADVGKVYTSPATGKKLKITQVNPQNPKQFKSQEVQ